MDKICYILCGEKGNCKTTTALGFNGKIRAFSWDGKTKSIWENWYNKDSRIKITDVREMIIRTKGQWRYTSSQAVERVKLIIESIPKNKYDWFFHDSIDDYAKTCEMKMRYKHNLSVFQGVSERGLWNERFEDLCEIYDTSVEKSKYGIILTCMLDLVDVQEEGEDFTKVWRPAWTKFFEKEGDIIGYLNLRRIRIKNINRIKNKLELSIISSKRDKQLFKTGELIDLTNISISDWAKKNKRRLFLLSDKVEL